MTDKNPILSQSSLKDPAIKIIYTSLLLGISLIVYIHYLHKYDQFNYQGAETTVLPIPNVGFLLQNPHPNSFEMSFYRFHDVQSATLVIQIFIQLKLQSKFQSNQEVMMDSKISIMRSGVNRGYTGTEVENKRIQIKLSCNGTCKPQILFEYPISMYKSDYMIAIEILNPVELYNQGVEAFNTGVLTGKITFSLKKTIVELLLLIISTFTLPITTSSIGTSRDPCYLRIFNLCGIFVSSNNSFLFNGRIRILIKEVVFTLHSAILMLIWFHTIKNILGKRYGILKKAIVAMVAISSFLVYHLLLGTPLVLSSFVLAGWSIFTVAYNYQKFKQSSPKNLAFFIILSTHVFCYLYILSKDRFDFLGFSEYNLLFNLGNTLFTFLIAILHYPFQNKVADSTNDPNVKEYHTVVL